MLREGGCQCASGKGAFVRSLAVALITPCPRASPQVETRATGGEREVGTGEVEHLGTTVSARHASAPVNTQHQVVLLGRALPFPTSAGPVVMFDTQAWSLCVCRSAWWVRGARRRSASRWTAS